MTKNKGEDMTNIDIADLRDKLAAARTWLAEHPHFHAGRKTDVKNLAAGVEALLDEIERLRTVSEGEVTALAEALGKRADGIHYHVLRAALEASRQVGEDRG